MKLDKLQNHITINLKNKKIVANVEREVSLEDEYCNETYVLYVEISKQDLSGLSALELVEILQLIEKEMLLRRDDFDDKMFKFIFKD